MYRSFAASFAVCLVPLSAALATPAHAADSLPDPHILSAAPFEFQADREIFSRMSTVPSDSRIFSPRRAKPQMTNAEYSQVRVENRTRL
ncbi:hypothetical protein [Candidatus Burkholderia verschuerenii]|uniref:hypothetical protein n=1 Tax=Candidatus Burkholderia verschuerenii TaxID=242163 RepID=UPI00067B2D72|nr:hypothetical protein [Candidatus Burkholderia verschuerenii]